MQIKQVNINKKDLSIYKKLIEAKKFVSTQIRRPYMITIIVLTFFMKNLHILMRIIILM